ncbi:hypothetical protein [Gottfriedia acidiceleris]|uniref:hypothetical protein n=1 Tax=Gottfriedia acidiceleris TaxID=371036 RepID=UPI002FFFCBC5
MSTKEVYSILKDRGFLDGKPGKWILTELGKQAGGLERIVDNFEHGSYNRSWTQISWDEKILNIFKKK